MTNRSLEAYCGLYCGACPVHLKREEDWIVQIVLREHGLEMSDLHCEGCRTDTLSPSCRSCRVRDCAKSKGLDSCAPCNSFPCERIARFGSVRPHAQEVVGNLTFLRDHGSEAWLSHQSNHWACPQCGRVGSWYETHCSQCGSHLPAGHDHRPWSTREYTS